MSKRKICVVVTARTSYTKFKPILHALKAISDIEIQVVCAASAVLEKFGQVDKAIEADGFTVADRLHCLLDSGLPLGMAKSTAVLLNDCAATFSRLNPDIVVVMADRFEVLAPAIASSYLNIPLAHIQGGETTGNIDQKVRHAITKLADLHFPATKSASNLLEKMDVNPSRIYQTGCPSLDIAATIKNKLTLSFDPFQEQLGVGPTLDLSNGYLVVLQHPVTNQFSQSRLQAEETLRAITQSCIPTFWFWPNSDAGHEGLSKALRVYRENMQSKNIYFIKNLEPERFLELVYFSRGVVGNSSVAIRECSFLGVPAVNIGDRQINRERGPNVVDVAPVQSSILQAILNLSPKDNGCHIYGSGDAGQKIAHVLSSVDLSFYRP